MSPDPPLSVAGLRKTFVGHLSLTRTTVVDGLSLDVLPGEIFGFLGANGAGKTTTIKMIVGLIFPTAGSIRILGRPHADHRSREKLGYLPENPYFYDYLTAEEFLAYYGRLYGMGGAAIARKVPAVLEQVGLAGKARVPLRKFSKGMLQRVGLAQTLLNDPLLVVLDEPMSGLDPIGRRDVRDIMLSLRRRGTTVFFSSHILQDAEMICDRVAIIASGRLVTAGPLSELLRGERHGYEVTLRGVPHAAAERLGSFGTLGEERDGARLLRVGTPEELDRLLGLAVEIGARVDGVAPQRQTLEDLFLEASGRA